MLRYISLSFIFLLCCCSKNIPLVEQGSETFSTVEEKESFLGKYFKVSSKSFEKLDFHIFYKDNSAGMVPAPSDWDICIIAQVPKSELNIWIKDLAELKESPKVECFDKVSTEIDYSGVSEWFGQGNNSFVGLDRSKSVIVFRSRTY